MCSSTQRIRSTARTADHERTPSSQWTSVEAACI
jgi:hypothetical protein